MHGAKLPESSLHSKLEPPSLELKPKLGEALLVGPEGPELIVVFGAWVSTVNARLAGLASVLPAASLARTSKLWAPSARPE